MELLNAPRQANESQQDYVWHQNVANHQCIVSGVPQQALSEVETVTTTLAEPEVLLAVQEVKTPRKQVTIKEEVDKYNKSVSPCHEMVRSGGDERYCLS